jgi:hypothetical protein
MDIEKFKLMLALIRPDYELDVYMANDGPCARIKMRDYIGHPTSPELLEDQVYYRYFSFGETLDDAARKVIEQWNKDHHGVQE